MNKFYWTIGVFPVPNLKVHYCGRSYDFCVPSVNDPMPMNHLLEQIEFNSTYLSPEMKTNSNNFHLKLDRCLHIHRFFAAPFSAIAIAPYLTFYYFSIMKDLKVYFFPRATYLTLKYWHGRQTGDNWRYFYFDPILYNCRVASELQSITILLFNSAQYKMIVNYRMKLTNSSQ